MIFFKIKNLKISTRLLIGFSIVVILSIIIGMTTLFSMQKQWESTEKMYKHSIIMNNEVRNIEANVLIMHRLMKDVALTENIDVMDTIENRLEEYQNVVFQSFDTISHTFPNDTINILPAKNAFQRWISIKNETIMTFLLGETDRTSKLTMKASEDTLQLVSNAIQKMINYSKTKQRKYYELSEKTKDDMRVLMGFLVGFVFLVGIVIAWLTSQSIIVPLNKILEGVKQISKGDLNKKIALDQKDEIGILANSFLKMQENLQEKATVARKISKGDLSSKVTVKGDNDLVAISINQIVDNFSEVIIQANMIADGDYSADIVQKSESDQLSQSLMGMIESLKSVVEKAKKIAHGDYSGEIELRSQNDQLAFSLNEMTRSLRKATQENQIQNWVKTGQNELNNVMRGTQELNDLGRNIINFLCKFMKLPIGIIYHAKGNYLLKMIGSYAYTRRKNLANKFRFGEGLIGQAALEKELFVIDNIPQDYITINSATGKSTPKTIMVVPCLDNEKVIGVIEIGSFRKFEIHEIEFMKVVSETIAMGMSSTIAQLEMQKVLAKSQHMAEELSAQQEELQQANAELEERTKALEESQYNLKSTNEVLEKQKQELRATNEELETRNRAIEAQRDDIRKKNEKLQQAQREIENKAKALEISSRYKSEFLANMSHELRTPLNSILVLSQLLGVNQGNNLTEKQIEFAQTINSSGTDLLNLINEILDLSKIESGKMDIHIEKVEIENLLGNVNRMFSQMIKDKGIYLHFDIATDIPREIESDGKRILQIIKNLVSNAVKFTKQGGITVTVSRPIAGTRFIKKHLQYSSCIAFSVRDTGIGIPDGKQDLIFQAFQQADGTTNRRYGGTGLGLTISRSFTNLLGGELQLESKKGEGSIFTLFVPERLETQFVSSVQVEETKRKFAQQEIQENNNNKSIVEKEKIEEKEDIESKIEEKQKEILVLKEEEKNIFDDRNKIEENDKLILVIEDDLKFAKVLHTLAHEKGFKCIVTKSGEKGLYFADAYSPNAIILDIGLPGINGWEVMDRLKMNPETRHIPVHFMSAYDQSIDALKKGAIGFLTKPITIEKLDEAFKKINSNINQSIKKLLIIEDDEVLRKSIIELIGNGDVVTTAIGSGEEAWQKITNDKFDCIILDLGLSDISGFSLLERIKESSPQKNIPIIIYTGKDLSREDEAKLEKYADSIIIKGVRSHERLLAETSLFLHRIEANLPKEKQQMIKVAFNKEAVLAGKKVLVVDDDMRNIFALSSVLEGNELNIIVGKNGKEGLEKLEQNPDIDLVLMDIMMPEMDGYEAMKKIRANSKFRKLPIIALTAKAMKGDRFKCIEAGANDYLSKPIDTNKLMSLLRVWLYK